MKPVFLIAIAAVAMIGVMVPSSFADWYVSEMNDFAIILSSDWDVVIDDKNKSIFGSNLSYNALLAPLPPIAPS